MAKILAAAGLAAIVMLSMSPVVASGATGQDPGPPRSSWGVQPTGPTTLAPATTPSDLHPATRATTFGKADTPRTTFTLADVAPSRLAAVRQQLTALGAAPRNDGSILIVLPGDIFFDFDQDSLRADAMPALNRLVQLLADVPRRQVDIAGHTDSKGDDAYNTALSLRRARAVRRHLESHLTTPRAGGFTVRGEGERMPVAPNAHADGSDDPQGRQRNRRVEVTLRPATTREGA